MLAKKSAPSADNAAFECNDEENTKEEEVYQDLCAIQNNIVRNQVFLLLFIICFFFRILSLS